MFEALEPRNLLSVVMVTSLGDTVADDGLVTLREAIIAANTDTSVDGSAAGDGDDEIVFDPSLAGGTITLGGVALPSISDNLSITGLTGDDTITIDADSLSRIFEVQTTISVTITSMLLTNGNSGDENGGAIHNAGLLTIIDSTISNSATLADEPGEGGGAIYNSGTLLLTTSTLTGNTAVNALGNGGGILGAEGSTTTITASNFIANIAARAGGAIESIGELSVDGSTFTSNGTGINGGAIHTSNPTAGTNSATISDSTFTANTAGSEGGGVWVGSAGTLTLTDTDLIDNFAQGADADQGGGGAFSAGGVLIINGGSITGNEATGASGSGGGVMAELGSVLTITGTLIDGNTANRAGAGIEHFGNGVVTLDGVTLSNNVLGTAPGNGGGLHVTGAVATTITDSTVTGNTAVEGGGLWNSATGTMTITGTAISGNTATGNAADQGGGGVFNNGGVVDIAGSTISDNHATGTSGSGGGIFNEIGGDMDIVGSTISGNTAVRAGGGIEDNASQRIFIVESSLLNNTVGSAPGNGGGLHITGSGDVTLIRSTVAGNTANEGGGLWNSAVGEMRLENSTVSGNTSTTSTGGGIHNDGGTILIEASTIASNTAATGGGGVNNTDGGSVTATNTIIALNDLDGGTGPDINGALESDRFNLIGNTSGATISGDTTGNVVNVDPRLAPLADNGGPTLTHLPLNFSPVIDTGLDTGLGVDQRNVARPIGAGFDIGAVESENDPIPPFEDRGPDDRGRFTFIDADGDEVTISLNGTGTFVVRVPAGSGVDVNADAIAVIVNGTDGGSKLQIKTKGSGGTTVNQILVNGDLNSVDAKTTNLMGTLLTGAVQKVTLADVQDSIITIGDDTTPDGEVSLSFGRVSDSSITSELNIKSLQLVDWQNTDDDADTITAPLIGKLQTKGDNRNNIAGDFEANLVLTGVVDEDTLDNASIKGNVTGVTWDITGTTDKVKIDGSVSDFTLLGAGSANRLQLGDVSSAVIELSGALGQLTATRVQDGVVDVNSLGKLQTKGDKRNSIDGDFAADVIVAGNGIGDDDAVDSVKVAGDLGGVWMVDGSASKIDVGMNLVGQLYATTFSQIKTKGDFTGDIFAGANLGADGVLGSGDDTFTIGSIDKLDIGGNVVDAQVLVGYDPVDDVYFNGNDAVLGGAASFIDRMTIKGTASNDSLFVAGQFPDTVSINKVKVDPSTDARFSTTPIAVL